MAEDDKIRYSQQINAYDGPLHIPVSKKRGKQPKFPVLITGCGDMQGAPKRAMSPFLFFSNEKRGLVQSENPDMKITEVSAKLGEMWRLMSDEEKKPYVERSRIDRDRYRSQQNEFKGKLPHTELGKNTTSISAPIPSVVASSQWNIPVADNTTNNVYSRVYDIPSQQTTFTNISIPIGFNSRCLRVVSCVDIIQ